MSVKQINKHLKNNRNKMIEGKKCSNVNLKIRKIGKWVDVKTDDIFKGKKVILFSLPGAFTPVCSEKQLPGFEENYDKLLGLGINEIYCISVNDGFVMNAWADHQKLKKVKVLPDGNADFTRSMGMLVEKKHVGFGQRSWRYCAIIDDGIIEKWWQEDGMNNEGSDKDPYEQTTPDNCLKYLSKK
jgi:thioredoxin-dependent peroxiredoxin